MDITQCLSSEKFDKQDQSGHGGRVKFTHVLNNVTPTHQAWRGSDLSWTFSLSVPGADTESSVWHHFQSEYSVI